MSRWVGWWVGWWVGEWVGGSVGLSGSVGGWVCKWWSTQLGVNNYNLYSVIIVSCCGKILHFLLSAMLIVFAVGDVDCFCCRQC